MVFSFTAYPTQKHVRRKIVHEKWVIWIVEMCAQNDAIVSSKLSDLEKSMESMIQSQKD